jgi:hypothetical protein
MHNTTTEERTPMKTSSATHRRRLALAAFNFATVTRVTRLLTSIFALMVTFSTHAQIVANGGSGLALTSVPPPGNLGYVYYATDSPDGVISTTPIGLSSSGNLASPVSWVSIATTGDSFYSSSVQDEYHGGCTTLTVNGTSHRTGAAYQSVIYGGTATLATITLQTGVPATFQLGVLEDNAVGRPLNQASVTVTGSNSVVEPVAGNGGVAFASHNDFYYFDIVGALAGQTLTISTTNNGTLAGFSYCELGGITFDTIPVPEPTSVGLLAVGALLAACRRSRAMSKSRHRMRNL